MTEHGNFFQDAGVPDLRGIVQAKLDMAQAQGPAAVDTLRLEIADLMAMFDTGPSSVGSLQEEAARLRTGRRSGLVTGGSTPPPAPDTKRRVA